jgi:cytochrome c peroxidase
MYNDNEFEILGVPENENTKLIDKDTGREKVTKSAIHQFAFKTPSLRNVELTTPYMHNGIYTTLDSVIVFYNKGGGRGLGMNIENQTLPFDSLGLTKKEMKDIKNFLLCLTDTSSLPKLPKRLPEFRNEVWNKRKIGGEY